MSGGLAAEKIEIFTPSTGGVAGYARRALSAWANGNARLVPGRERLGLPSTGAACSRPRFFLILFMRKSELFGFLKWDIHQCAGWPSISLR
jgi:hypothetical protein